MPSLTVENYLKAIYQLSEGDGAGCVATGQIADVLDVLPGTVTSMLKTLAEGQLASYTPYEGAELTNTGRALALRVIRRHRLIELFLVQTLDLAWDEVHDEAEHMEHAVSDWLVDRMEKHLGHPKFDPHGDPIPSADGSISLAKAIPLADCLEGQDFQVVRVLDQSPEFLRELSKAGISLGVAGDVAQRHDDDGGRTLNLGTTKRRIDAHMAKNLGVHATGM